MPWSIQRDCKYTPLSEPTGRGDFLVDKGVAGAGGVWYNLPVTASYTGTEGRCSTLEILLSLTIAVAAGVISHLICKWLDGDK